MGHRHGEAVGGGVRHRDDAVMTRVYVSPQSPPPVGSVADVGDDAHGYDAGVVADDAVVTDELSAISEVQIRTEHPDIRQTLYFDRRGISLIIALARVLSVVSKCECGVNWNTFECTY